MGKTALKNILLGLVAAGILAAMSAMALTSRLNVHPDELDHVNAGRYFMQYWDFPAMDDPRLAQTFSNYGVTYLQQLDIVYFFAGKFAAAVLPLVGQDYIALRFFNIFLFAVLMGLFLRLPDNRKIAFLPLFITPQIWYVFSYFNGDAFPMFLTFGMVYCIARLDLPIPDLPCAWRSPATRRLLGTGVLLGLVCISKQNYYVFAAFTLAFFGVCGLSAGNLKAAAKNACVVFALAAILFGLRSGYNVYLNRTVRPDTPTCNAEKYAQNDYKPSAQQTGNQFWGLRMRDQGLTYPQLFTIWTWHIWSFRTSFGVYDFMASYSRMRSSAHSLLAPYIDLGPFKSKSTSMPATLQPRGPGPSCQKKRVALSPTGIALTASYGYTRLVERNTTSALFFRASSRQLMVPVRLVSRRYRGLPPKPANTDGSAEHSSSRSMGVENSRSSGLRMSPCTTRTPAAARRGRLYSDPRRRRLSRAMTVRSGVLRFKATARLLPTKPAPPVTSTVLWECMAAPLDKTGTSAKAGTPRAPAHTQGSRGPVAGRSVPEENLWQLQPRTTLRPRKQFHGPGARRHTTPNPSCGIIF